MSFDSFLLSLVRQHSPTEVITGLPVDAIDYTPTGTLLINGNNPNDALEAQAVIGADGANSVVARKLAAKKLEREHFFSAVRAYYTGVKNTQGNEHQVFFNSQFNFNYLWIFPIDGNIANVGFGMLASEAAKNKVNLKDTFYNFIEATPRLKHLFMDARQVSPLEGFGVPLGSKMGSLSGNNYLLAGEAGSLSNPVSGTGMGNAMLSGKLAGEQLIQCFAKNTFNAAFMQQYDAKIQQYIINDLMKTYRYQRTVASLPYTMDIVFGLGQVGFIKRYIQRVV
ncbi:MAG: NAD(P)/FAD-dependent oxidoreductase [Chitinophagia bacterium]|nr:NAD(P)/FAD-dependent oxidoreductase [Chitinophagia bacterium]